MFPRGPPLYIVHVVASRGKTVTVPVGALVRSFHMTRYILGDCFTRICEMKNTFYRNMLDKIGTCGHVECTSPKSNDKSIKKKKEKKKERKRKKIQKE